MKKWTITIITGILLLMMYAAIYGFSGQDAEQSSGLSHKVSRTAVDAADKLAKKNWTAKQKEEMVENMETPVRKMAHFSEYAVTGILLCILLTQWIENRKRLVLLAGIWIFLTACADEFHQTFIPGRDGNFIDVCIDTSGGMIGLLLTMGIICLFLKKRKKKLSA